MHIKQKQQLIYNGCNKEGKINYIIILEQIQKKSPKKKGSDERCKLMNPIKCMSIQILRLKVSTSLKRNSGFFEGFFCVFIFYVCQIDCDTSLE